MWSKPTYLPYNKLEKCWRLPRMHITVGCQNGNGKMVVKAGIDYTLQ